MRSFIKYMTIILSVVFTAINFGCKKDDPIQNPDKAPFNIIKGFVIDNNNNKLVATEKGLFKLDLSSGNYNKVEIDETFSGFNTLKVFDYEVAGNLYLGSNTGALNYSEGTIYNESNSNLISNTVLSIGLHLSQALLFGTPKGISILDGGIWTLHTGRDDFYLNHRITDMGTTTKGHTFVSTSGGGIGMFQIAMDGVSGATVLDTDWTLLPSDSVNTVFIYDTVQFYGTVNGVGIHSSEFTKSDWKALTHKDGLIANNVLSINRTPDGVLWFGTDAGLSSYNRDAWVGFTKEKDALIANVVKYMAVDNDGLLWIATDNGLGQYNNHQWINYPTIK